MKQNNAVPSPSLSDLIQKTMRTMAINLNCVSIGQVQDFDKDRQTCTVKFVYTKRISEQDSSGIYTTREIEYPILLDCPTVFLRGGKSGMTFPVSQNDYCILLFCDRDIDNWFDGSSLSPLKTNRAHSISDAIALVGISNLATLIEDFDESNPHIFNEDSSFRIKNDSLDYQVGEAGLVASESQLSYQSGGNQFSMTDKLLVKNQTANLLTVMENFITAVQGIVSTPASPGNPVTLNLTSINNLNAVLLQIREILRDS